MKKWNTAPPAGTRWAVGRAGAYLYATAQPLVNRFTAARLEIQLEEPRGSRAQSSCRGFLCAGPHGNGGAGSEDCYVIVQVSQSDPAAWQAAGVEYGYSDGTRFAAGVHQGWQPVPGAAGMWYRRVPSAAADQTFGIFDLISVPATATGEELAAAAANEITISAWAVQADGVADPRQAAEQLGLLNAKSKLNARRRAQPGQEPGEHHPRAPALHRGRRCVILRKMRKRG